MKNKKLVYGAVIVLAVIVALFLIANVKSDDKVRVGVVIPLTGDASIYGEAIRNGMTLAQEDIKDSKLEVIYEDACLAQDALKSGQKLVNIDGVDMISGVFCIVAVNGLIPVTKDKKIPIMMTAAVPESLVNQNAFVFSPNSAIRDEAYAQAEYAYNVLGARNASVLWMNSDFGDSYSKNFEKRFVELGGKVLTNEPLEFFGTDYKTDLTKVKDKSPDVLLAVHFGTQMGLILKQSKEVGLKSKIIGTYESEDQFIVDSAAGGAEGLILSTPVGGKRGSVYEDFTRRYYEKFNEEPPLVARMGYDSLMIEVNAYKSCNGADKDCVVQKMTDLKNYDGASGIFDMSSDGTGKRTFIFKTVKNGTYVALN